MRTDATPQLNLPLDCFCCGPLFAPVRKQRPPVRPRGKEGVVHRAQTVRATPPWSTASLNARATTAAKSYLRKRASDNILLQTVGV